MTSDYAPQYAGRERIARLALAGLSALATYAAHRLWLLPLVRDLGDHPGCRSVFGIDGVSALFQGLFVGVPLLAAIVLLVLQGPTLVRTLRTRTFPPPGQRTLGRVRIRRGWPALLLASMQALLIAILFVIALRGVSSARELAGGSVRPARAQVCGGAAVWPARTARPSPSNATSAN